MFTRPCCRFLSVSQTEKWTEMMPVSRNCIEPVPYLSVCQTGKWNRGDACITRSTSACFSLVPESCEPPWTGTGVQRHNSCSVPSTGSAVTTARAPSYRTVSPHSHKLHRSIVPEVRQTVFSLDIYPKTRLSEQQCFSQP